MNKNKIDKIQLGLLISWLLLSVINFSISAYQYGLFK